MPDLALVDDRLLVAVQELDRVLDRDDVLRAWSRLISVDHRGQRRGLAGAGGAGDEDDPALLLGQLGDHRRQAQLLDRADRRAGSRGRRSRSTPRWRKALTRKRARPGTANEKSTSFSASNSLSLLVVVEHLLRTRSVSSGLSGSESGIGSSSPWVRISGRRGDLQVKVGALRLDDVA